jgi:hypothetical protein
MAKEYRIYSLCSKYQNGSTKFLKHKRTLMIIDEITEDALISQ